MKWLFRGVFFLAALIALVVVFRNQVIKAAAGVGTKAVLGVQLDIADVNVGLGQSLVSLKGIQLHNPAGFADPLFVDIPLVHVDYNLSDILKGNIHLEDVRLHLKEVMLIRDKNGKLNIDALKPPAPAKKEEPAPAPQPSGKPAPAPKFQIDHLELKVERVIYKDYTVGDNPIAQTFEVNIDEKHDNITKPEVLIPLIAAKVFKNAALARLTNLNSEFLQQNVFDTATLANKAVNDVAGQLEGKLTNATGEVTGVLGEQGAVVQEKAKALFGSLKNKIPVGSSQQTAAQN